MRDRLALFDTNILIDLMNGHESARTTIARHKHSAISTITWVEVLAGVPREERPKVRRFLDEFLILPIGSEILEKTVELRFRSRMKLPDCIIFATASLTNRILVTRNTRDFPQTMQGVEIPYHL